MFVDGLLLRIRMLLYCHVFMMQYQYIKKQFFKISRNSNTVVSELLNNLEDMFSRYYMRVQIINYQNEHASLLKPFHIVSSSYSYTGNEVTFTSSGFLSTSEAFASEVLKNPEEMFLRYYMENYMFSTFKFSNCRERVKVK